jgi:uncharacterized protein YndB with AHSA1/START domain
MIMTPTHEEARIMGKQAAHTGRMFTVLAAAAAVATVASAASAAERAIDKTIDVPATMDQAWDAWTTEAGITSFMAPAARIEPRPGGLFEIHFDPLAQAGDRGADDMRYLALQPKTMLSFTWNAPPSLPQARSQGTAVIVRFEPLGDKQVRVSLHHVGWGDGGEWDQAYAYFDKAWGKVLGNLKTRFESGPIDWSDWLAQLRKAHEQPLPPKP